MKIPAEEKSKWESIYEHGDYVAIQKESGFDRNVIKGAFTGNCSFEVYAAIRKFYMAREKQFEKKGIDINALVRKSA